MRNFTNSSSLLCLQQQDSGIDQALTSDSNMPIQTGICNGEFGCDFSCKSGELEMSFSQAQLEYGSWGFPSGFSYFAPPVPSEYQCAASSAVESSKDFGEPFQLDFIDSRKRKMEEPVVRDNQNMIGNEVVQDQLQIISSKKKGIEQSIDVRVLKAPAVRRSQKLSDKITALQKVVSPYGKTDTASVLQETCMYIKIAHQEIRRLSISYFGIRTPPHPQFIIQNGATGKLHPDLQSRGLCLVPLSMTKLLTEKDTNAEKRSNSHHTDQVASSSSAALSSRTMRTWTF